jgi:hypothetical protein
MPQGKIDPANSILIAGYPLISEYEVRTVAGMYPGKLVMNDTNDYSIKACTTAATTCLGVLDVEPNELKTTIYTQYDQARVLTGPIVVLLLKDSGLVTVPGTLLMAGDVGTVTPGSAAGTVVARALETSTVAREWVKAQMLI